MRYIPFCTLSFGLTFQVAAQNFSLYPNVNPDNLAQAFGISTECLDVLNTTLPCDQTLFQMVGNVDNYWWELENLTSLCTRDCFQAVGQWNIDVQTQCDGDTLVAYNKIIPADSVAGRYTEGMQIACLTNGNATYDQDVDPIWCLAASQEWVGSDVVRPDCSTNPTAPACIDPINVSPEDQRLANLYGNDVLCSECFIQMMYQRLSSPYLPDHDYSDYLVSQYQDILDVCNYTNNIPALTVTAQPTYATATPPPLNLSSVANTGCTGQTIVKSTLSPGANCASIAQAFKVPTGGVQIATGNTNCNFQTDSVCLPLPCTLQQVPSGATCDSLAASMSTSQLNVTTVQFLTWNPNINGLCDSLTVGDYICAGAPGGVYIPPPPPPGSANATGQARGGNDGSDVGSGTGASPSGVGSNAPSPTQSGIVTGCTKYNQPNAGAGCEDFAKNNSITPAELYSWNTILGPNGANCSNEFFLGYYYCVAAPPSNTTSATPTGSSTPLPSPTQSGIASNCNKYAVAQKNEYCSLFAQEHGITTDNLYKWNAILGANGAHCNDEFFVGYEYCIGVSG